MMLSKRYSWNVKKYTPIFWVPADSKPLLSGSKPWQRFRTTSFESCFRFRTASLSAGFDVIFLVFRSLLPRCSSPYHLPFISLDILSTLLCNHYLYRTDPLIPVPCMVGYLDTLVRGKIAGALQFITKRRQGPRKFLEKVSIIQASYTPLSMHCHFQS